jgi:hypothetical protein
MGAMMMVAASAAQAAADLFERFRVADATAADRAVPLSQLGLTPDRLVARYEQAGVLRQARAGRYYLDETALAVYRRQRSPRVLLIAVAGILCMLGIAIAAMAASHAPRVLR